VILQERICPPIRNPLETDKYIYLYISTYRMHINGYIACYTARRSDRSSCRTCRVTFVTRSPNGWCNKLYTHTCEPVSYISYIHYIYILSTYLYTSTSLYSALHESLKIFSFRTFQLSLAESPVSLVSYIHFSRSLNSVHEKFI